MLSIKIKLGFTIASVTLLLLCSACQNNTALDNGDGQYVYESSLQEQYVDQLNDIDHITILHGMSGEKTEIEDDELVSLWIQNVNRLPIILNSKEEIDVGYMYAVKMYRDDQLIIQFTNNGINEKAVVDSHALVHAIESLIQRSIKGKG